VTPANNASFWMTNANRLQNANGPWGAKAFYYDSVDHLNRPLNMTDAGKASVWDAVWQPWGGVHSVTGTASLDARFPGQWFQAETSLHYNWHRQSDPTVGRYTHGPAGTPMVLASSIPSD
jgi:RHS repeat-associated protein